MLPGDMSLKIESETAGYNKEILVSDNGFSLGKNNMVSTSVSEKSSHNTSIFLKHVHKEVPSKHTLAILN